MTGLGLDEDAEAVYQAALRRPRWRVAELARYLDRPEPAVGTVVERLRADGLLVTSAEQAASVRAVEPCLALPALAASRVWGLSAGVTRPQAAAIARFIAQHEQSAAAEPESGGLDAIGSLVERLIAGARHEVVLLSPLHRPGSFEFSTLIAEAVLRRGAVLRCLWRTELVRQHSLAAYANWLRARGAQPRVVPTLPINAVLVDRSVAVVLRERGAVVNRTAATVAPLCALADQLWARGTTVYGGATPQPAGQAPRHRRVLRLLAEGLTDDAIARQVGVSVRTVRNDMAAAMVSLDARSRFQAGVRAAQLGLL
ncbi:helix-turn-helix transcriptional regulator [Kutzneria albida]|uniref:HTH luxR-type domain-containing protein n=1 Tax=Kutzneria albida DSM 43870 TaxID=1449976 RepID=W5W0T0_9PSEU|nr:helix-turn-helix transcriptional regulator [Kutzneria albida]AHH94778.1 hypothetical protein KALB_1405 [Kutzneria albida DSM 43870]